MGRIFNQSFPNAKREIPRDLTSIYVVRNREPRSTMKFLQPTLVHLSYLPHTECQDFSDDSIFKNLESLKHLPQVNITRKCHLETNVNCTEVPLCIVGPLMYLKERYFQAKDYYSKHCFIEEISDKAQLYPYSHVDGCSVCESVEFLMESCLTYEECAKSLETKTQIFIFEVIREICNRLRPGLLVLSRDFYTFMKENDFLDTKKCPPALRNFREFNNARFSGVSKRQKDENQILNILTIKMHEAMAVSNHAPLISFIFVTWSRIVRNYIAKSNILGKKYSSHAPFYVEEKTATKPIELKRIIWTLGKAIAGGLVAVDMPNFRRNDREAKRVLIQTCMNILASNRVEIFSNDQNLKDKLIHVRNCDGSEICYCYYLRNALSALKNA